VSDGDGLICFLFFRGDGRMALSLIYFLFFFENDIFAVCHDLAYGKYFLLTFSIYFF